MCQIQDYFVELSQKKSQAISAGQAFLDENGKEGVITRPLVYSTKC